MTVLDIKTKTDHTKAKMFLDTNGTPSVQRFDVVKYRQFEKFTEKQLGFFWRPEEVDILKDAKDFKDLTDFEQHIFTSNLKRQILLDSVQGRSPNLALLPIVGIPELETWIETWAFSETIHSRSYTHIIRNITNDPSLIFDDIVGNKDIVERAEYTSRYYDDLINYQQAYNLHGEGVHKTDMGELDVNMHDLKRKLYMCLMSVNVLEAIRFYVSFACSFAFAERGLMEGNAKIIKLIARDEQLHLSSTQHMINLIRTGQDDPEMAEIAEECKQDAADMFKEGAEQEKEWAEYLFKDGSMLGLNKEILCQYVEYITDVRVKAIGIDPIFNVTKNPIPWMKTWLASDTVQVAPQEVEISSYLVGQVDSEVNIEDLGDFEL